MYALLFHDYRGVSRKFLPYYLQYQACTYVLASLKFCVFALFEMWTAINLDVVVATCVLLGGSRVFSALVTQHGMKY